MATMSLTWDRVNAWRMGRHNLSVRAPRNELVEVARRVCGVQAQVMSAAEMALGARVEGIRPETVQSALWEERSLVKTWSMRGTLHLIAAQDFPAYVPALSTRVAYRRPVWLRYHNLTLEELDACIEGVREALDGHCLTREELASEVASKTGNPHLGDKLMSGWGELLKPPAYHGYICFGPSRRQAVKFVRPDQWIGPWDQIDPQEALRELARRYLSAYGPATHAEFARWFGVEPAHGRRVFAGMQAELADVDIEGTKAQALERDLESLSAPQEPPLVRLLPNFDPYTVGAYSLRLPLTDEQKARVSRAGAWISPIVLVRGRLAGTWKQEKRRNTLAVTVEMFDVQEPSREIKEGIEEEAERAACFLDLHTEATELRIAYSVEP